MAFKFNLEQILHYRNGLESQAQEELAKRNQAMEEEARRLAMMQEEEVNVRGYCRLQEDREVDLTYLDQAHRYLNFLEGRIVQQAQEKEKAREKVDEQREELRRCWQERRVMEILKEKAWDSYKHEEKRVERMVIDELTLNSFARNSGGS